MKCIKTLSLLAALSFGCCITQAQKIRIVMVYTTGYGTATDADAGLAIEEVTQTAENLATPPALES